MKRQHKVLVLLVNCLTLLVFPAGRTQAADPVADSKSTEKVVDAYITVMAMAYPPAGGALKAAKSLMGMLGFFDKPDAVGEAISKINQRLDELDRRIGALEATVAQLQNEVFRNANLARTRQLRGYRGRLQLVLVRLEQKPADRGARIVLAKEAQVIAEEFLVDQDLWRWSDLVLKDHTWAGRLVRAGTMLPPDFKPMPTLEYYAMALATWMTAAEFAADGDYEWVKRTHGQDLQRHIDFLSVRPGWDESRQEPLTLPEHLKRQISALLEPGQKYPRNLMYSINTFTVDSLAREIQPTAVLQARASSDNELATVPPGLQNRATPEEEALERAYGIETMEFLARKLGRLKDYGTAREQELPGPLIPTLPSDFRKSAPIYAVAADGALKFYRHNGAGGGQAAWAPAGAPAGTGWSQYKHVFGGGGNAVYAITHDGRLFWREHRETTTADPNAWVGPVEVNAGWQSFKHVFSCGDGVIYAVTPDGVLKWYRHRGFLSGHGNADAWVGPRDVGTGWHQFRHAFGGENGDIYAIRTDGTLLLYKHRGYLDGRGMESPGAWEGPETLSSGWGDFRQVFAAGDGVLYAVTADGTLQWYRYVRPGSQPSQAGPPVLPRRNLADLIRQKTAPATGGAGATVAPAPPAQAPRDGLLRPRLLDRRIVAPRGVLPEAAQQPNAAPPDAASKPQGGVVQPGLFKSRLLVGSPAAPVTTQPLPTREGQKPGGAVLAPGLLKPRLNPDAVVKAPKESPYGGLVALPKLRDPSRLVNYVWQGPRNVGSGWDRFVHVFTLMPRQPDVVR